MPIIHQMTIITREAKWSEIFSKLVFLFCFIFVFTRYFFCFTNFTVGIQFIMNEDAPSKMIPPSYMRLGPLALSACIHEIGVERN